MNKSLKGSRTGAFEHPATDWLSRPALWAIVVGVLSIVYLAQTATPLRLDDDTVDYLRMAAAMADGRIVPGLPLPTGYSIFLSVLDRAGFASSFYFVLANCVFLALGLFSAWKLLADYPRLVRRATLLFTMLAIPVVKSAPIALPEAAFFGVSLLALWAMSAAGTASGWSRRGLLASSFACIAAAVAIRTVGLALLPAFFWVCFQLPADRANDERKARLRGWIIVAAALAIMLLIYVSRSEAFLAYQGWLQDYYGKGDVVRQIVRRISFVLSGLGEIVVNVPFSRLRDLRFGFGVVGVVSLVAFVVGSRKTPVPVTPARIYLLTYFVVVAVWPNPSPRLWMPVIPLIVAEAGRVLSELPHARWKTPLVGTYAGWFALTGIAALVYTSRISFAGANFENVYGRRGGMPTVEVDVTDPNWGHLQYYKAEAKKMTARYGGGVRR